MSLVLYCTVIVKCRPDGGARWKVRASPKSEGFILWEPWLYLRNYEPIHPVDFERLHGLREKTWGKVKRIHLLETLHHMTFSWHFNPKRHTISAFDHYSKKLKLRTTRIMKITFLHESQTIKMKLWTFALNCRPIHRIDLEILHSIRGDCNCWWRRKEKSGHPQSQPDSSSGHQGFVFQISHQSIKQLRRHFSPNRVDTARSERLIYEHLFNCKETRKGCVPQLASILVVLSLYLNSRPDASRHDDMKKKCHCARVALPRSVLNGAEGKEQSSHDPPALCRRLFFPPPNPIASRCSGLKLQPCGVPTGWNKTQVDAGRLPWRLNNPAVAVRKGSRLQYLATRASEGNKLNALEGKKTEGGGGGGEEEATGTVCYCEVTS